MAMDKKWTIQSCDAEQCSRLGDALGIHPVLCRLLANRGIGTFEDARRFFRPSPAELHDPWLMKDMDKAVQRLETAVSRGEKILVYGDYDVDGTTAVAVVYDFLLPFCPAIDFYIPHRYREGYGLSAEGIRHAGENGVTLLICLDCGIKAVDKIAFARTLGIDVIVCDHHLPGAALPPATAILNPKQPGCPYPYKELSGCGIGFKLIQAWAGKRNIPEQQVLRYLDLVATSIAADIVPLTGENRALAFYGLKQANEQPSAGLKALIEQSGLKKTLHISDLVFSVAPRVNAAGRMDDARKAVLLFIEQEQERAREYAAQLHRDNLERKEADADITREALELLSEQPVRSTTVLFKPHWHKGVVGIVASRLMESYYRPTIVLTRSGEQVAGSARSVSGFNICEALHACRDLLDNYGGHAYAAGMTLKPENVAAFGQRFESVVAGSIDPALLVPEIRIDAEIQLQDITPRFYRILSQFEPFGPDNNRPVFMVRNLRDTGYSRIVKEAHLRLEVRDESGIRMKGIGFNLACKYPLVRDNAAFDLCFTLEENEWNGYTTLQLNITDIRSAEPA
ncbi:single-stranded-DNA-specific exonuclease RecJ [Compostibacter hankyongensis]|uniref:Single-stranded-DNA-specific exonuclease RecJ n=1 Tax=Compostibacter hankyongensis TaxID=1007089 RepID=A0ABP8FGL4_9BACT